MLLSLCRGWKHPLHPSVRHTVFMRQSHITQCNNNSLADAITALTDNHLTALRHQTVVATCRCRCCCCYYYCDSDRIKRCSDATVATNPSSGLRPVLLLPVPPAAAAAAAAGSVASRMIRSSASPAGRLGRWAIKRYLRSCTGQFRGARAGRQAGRIQMPARGVQETTTFLNDVSIELVLRKIS